MTIPAFDQSQKEQLLQIVAEEFPVFVLGPGCYRVGFDNPDDKGWSDVEHRVADLLARLEPGDQTFLREFFFSKLSEERREQPGRSTVDRRLNVLAAEATERWEQEQELGNATDLGDEGPTAAAATQFSPWRTLLAKRLLQAYRHASCCLGLVIGEGRSPVMHWQDASVPTETIAEWSEREWRGAAAGGEDDSRHHFLASRQAIRSAARVARAMDRLRRCEHLSGDEITALQELPLAGLDLEASVRPALVGVLARPLDLLLPSRMAAMLQVLDDKCFKPEYEPLRGANIEWLGDLLWHVLSSDAEVQPSQADLAFYVTLSEQASPRPRDLRRPAYGDRMAGNFDITRLTTRSQPDDQPDQPARGDRESLLRTVAMCILAQYAIVDVAHSIRTRAVYRNADPLYTPDELPYVSAMDRYVLALVGDYGDKLERAIFELLADKATFHIGVPVWLSTKNSRRIDWLLMGVRRGPSNAPALDWQWLAEVDEVSGPILIKLNGCDRCPMGASFIKGKVANFPFIGGGSQRHRNATIELAVLYDEHDRLTAMQSFDELIADTGGGLVSGLATYGKGLTWRDRSWVIMGQRFADWIPRLRLFTHKWIGSKDTKEASATNYWAIDRSFDWPERSLLKSLGITMVTGELRAVVNALTVEAFTDRQSSPVGRRFAELFMALSRR